MSDDLQARFAASAEEAKILPKKPDNNTLLKMYALYKQGSEGDITGERPSMMDFKGGAKYDAWKELQGTPKDKAMQDYIDFIERLKKRYSRD